MHEIIKFIASYFIIIPSLAVLYLLWNFRGSKRVYFAATLVLGGVAALVFARLASALYYDPRPFVQGHFVPLLPHGADNGFPSDHTLLSAFLAWAIFRHDRKIGTALLVVAALIGGARMAAGIHHLSDVVASFVLAALGLVTAEILIRLVKRGKAARA